MYKKFVLPSGLRVLMVEQPALSSTTVLALVKAGPVFDPADRPGLSHLVEHLLFKGTKRYPTSRDLFVALEKKGGACSGFTYNETNLYWVKIPGSNIEPALDVLSQQLQHSLFKLSDIEKEKDVVKEELMTTKTNPSTYIWEVWGENVWQGTLLGRHYAGNAKSLDRIGRSDIVEFVKERYSPQSTVFVVCGSASPDQVLPTINQYTADMGGSNQRADSYFLNLGLRRTKRPIKIVGHSADYLTVAYGFLTAKFADPDTQTLEVTGSLLGGGWGSILRQEIGNEGLTYSISTHTSHLSQSGYFLILFTAEPKNLNLIIKRVNHQIRNLGRGGFSVAELGRAKEYFVGSLITNHDSSDKIAFWYGDQEIIGSAKVLSLEEKSQLVRGVSKEDIIRVVKKYFTDDNWHLSLVGGGVRESDIRISFS